MGHLIEFVADRPPLQLRHPIPGVAGVRVDHEVVEVELADESLRFWWGHEGLIGTTAFWADQTRRSYAGVSSRLGGSLGEEVAACILGGFGMPVEVGLAAFERLRQAGALEQPDRERVEALLREPLALPNGGSSRYRFPRQRAERLCAALDYLRGASVPAEGRQLRDWLLDVPGVGPKTAGWIVRNHTGCQDVAIIDVHLRRAGVAAGFFSRTWRIERDYGRFEGAFLTAAQLADVSAAELDACIWGTLHRSAAVREAVSRILRTSASV